MPCLYQNCVEPIAKPAVAPKPIQPQQQAPQPAQQSFGALRSIGAGLQQDVSRAQQAIGGGVMPAMTPGIGRMAQVPEPDLSKTADPRIAGLTSAVAPMAIPFGGEEKLAAKGGELAEKYLPKFMPKIENETSNFLGRMAGKGVHGAAYMNSLGELFGSKDHGSNMLSNTIWGIASSVVPSAVLEGGIKKYGKPYIRMLASNIKNVFKRTGEMPSPEKIEGLANDLTSQTAVNPKELAKAPKLHWIYHNIFPYLPFTGVSKEL